MTTLRREDATNRRIALAYLAQGDYTRARGWAELLIDDTPRADLVATLRATMPAEHKAYEKAAKARRKAAEAEAEQWRAAQAARARKQEKQERRAI
jgi:Tfp pilus assembly protein PilF